ncbi:MAG: ATP-binding protein [bacterium]|nr:ATP-binding protein [bacterium]
MFKYNKKIKYSDLDQEITSISKNVEKLKLPGAFLEFIMYILSELSANIKEHSKAKNIYIKINLNKNCLIELTDDGIGFRKSYLSKEIYPKDDSAAIEFAIGGLSTKNLRGERGFGLYSVKKLISKLKGELIVKSGFTRATINENQIFFKKLPKEIHGVTIILMSKVKNFDFYGAVE